MLVISMTNPSAWLRLPTQESGSSLVRKLPTQFKNTVHIIFTTPEVKPGVSFHLKILRLK